MNSLFLNMMQLTSTVEMYAKDIEEGDLANFVFIDPDDPRKDYCVGYTFKGGNILDADRWQFDDANHWQTDADNDFIPISYEDLNVKIMRHGVSIRDVLAQCLSQHPKSSHHSQ